MAVAEELHFGRAADRLHRSTSSVSRHIGSLETVVGSPLLRRTSRQVHLTEAGRTLYADTADAVGVLRRALSAVRPKTREVRIGYVSAAAESLIPRLAALLEVSHPDVKLRLSPSSSSAQVEAMLAGQMDLAVQWAIGAPRLAPGLRATVLAHESLAVAVPPHHRLAGFPDVELADLADEPWLMAADASDHILREAFVAACRATGFTPRVVAAATGLHAQLTLVAAGHGICVVPSTAGQALAAHVSLAPLRGLDATLVAVTTADDDDLAAVLDTLCQVAQRHVDPVVAPLS